MQDTDLKIHQQFSEYGRNAKEWMRRCVLLLPEIECRQIWKKKKFFSIYEYAAKIAGMTRNTVDDALRILHKIEDKPALLKIVEQKGINSVRPVASIATTETQTFWAEKAKVMSRHTLETYVQNYRSESRTGPESQSVNLTITLDQKTATQLQKLKGNGTWEQLMQKLLAGNDLHIEKPVPVEHATRSIPAKIKKFVTERTNHHCAYPTCTKPSTSLHHTQRFKLHHTHDPDHIVPLCTPHERLAHLGLINNEEHAPQTWRVRDAPDQHNERFYVDHLVALYRR